MFTGAREAVSYLGMRDLAAQGLANNLDEALGNPVVQEGGAYSCQATTKEYT